MISKVVSFAATSPPSSCSSTTGCGTVRSSDSGSFTSRRFTSTNVKNFETQQQRVQILACSALIPIDHTYNYGRKLCEDRRQVFDHLKPRNFVRNTIRIAIVQSTNVITGYYNDHLKIEISREEKVMSGELTREQAELENDEWQEREWNRRMNGLTKVFAVAFLKYHSVVLIMRLYEYWASLHVTEVVLDALTMDTFECAKRTARMTDDNKTELGRQMFRTCWNANLISFLADYSLHQVILAYGYYIYVREQRKKLKSSAKTGSDEQQQKPALDPGPIALSFLRKSTLLVVSRGVGLGLSSVGGAVGSVLWPGWGTLVGINLGDSLALQLTEDTTPDDQR